MRSKLRSACLLALALASGSAQALGLGQIQVKSALGQPLLAEIPIVSSDPSELVSLDAGLASPETFTRIGLEPPIGIVADLRFTVGSDAQGRPLIRITTVQPVTQPLLDFLVQVDWGQGRLVREYTANLAAPGAVEAAPDVAVQAPAVESTPVIERPVATAPTPADTPLPTRAVPASRPPGAAPAGATAGSPAGGSEYRVRAGDTASKVASQVAPAGVTAEQAMVGLLRANPDAFVAGDLNQLRRGTVLRVPASAELEAIEAREAAALVRASASQWRQARSQPQAPVASAARAPVAAAAQAGPAGRLEIVPPGAGRQARGGTQSGIEAGGEGEMLRQELQTTKESLAARDAEVQELRSRLAELEKLQNDQQKLIAMQNSQLHAAQQRAPAQSTPPAPQASSALPWVIGGVAVLLAGLAAAAWRRRRARRDPVFRAPPESPRPSLADAFAPEAAAPAEPVVPPADPVDVRPSWERSAGRPPRAATRRPAAAPVATALAASDVAADAEPSPVERLELAQAYLDLGDANNARRLLGEVMDSDDATARGVAAKMLQDIG
ncbi:FimV/HubP family polar landmark protein [Cognatilysobacter segetis]|uniref:FimV/HubP family polar landmark protein n=1 Tax=Cognatilysobacter segetis TaxID=2492394 RepID=UPI00105C47F8|nr:FimV/HubP family polar landmark protein [Lysobacter segetis]